jgi:hypothetical protein
MASSNLGGFEFIRVGHPQISDLERTKSEPATALGCSAFCRMPKTAHLLMSSFKTEGFANDIGHH